MLYYNRKQTKKPESVSKMFSGPSDTKWQKSNFEYGTILLGAGQDVC